MSLQAVCVWPRQAKPPYIKLFEPSYQSLLGQKHHLSRKQRLEVIMFWKLQKTLDIKMSQITFYVKMLLKQTNKLTLWVQNNKNFVYCWASQIPIKQLKNKLYLALSEKRAQYTVREKTMWIKDWAKNNLTIFFANILAQLYSINSCVSKCKWSVILLESI